MSEGWKFWVTASVAVLISILMLAVVLFNTVERANCSREWQYSGIPHRFDWLGGCMLETRPGRWLPAKVYRELPP